MKKTLALIMALVLAFSLCSTAFAYEVEYTPEEVEANERALALQLGEEGIVMLKNENNALPLESVKVNVFGASALDMVASGGGSGSTGSGMNFYENLAAQGIEFNTELRDTYAAWYALHTNDTRYAGIGSLDNFSLATGVNPEWNITHDMPDENGNILIPRMDQAILDRAKEYSDTAIYIIARSGTEEHDLAPQELQLREEEAATLEYISHNFDKVIVLFNSGNMMELGYLEDGFSVSYDGWYYGGHNFNIMWYWFGCDGTYPPTMGTPVTYEEPRTYTMGNIDTMLVVWGMSNAPNLDAICSVLKGDVSPSGRLVDTIAYDYSTNPVSKNFGKFAYEDASLNEGLPNFQILQTDANADPTCTQYFLTYEEGIYLGYRYYETFAPDAVQFPFGYGIGYTDFEWSDFDYTIGTDEYGEDQIQISVKVTNTGDKAGKDVVEVYYTAPFYNDSAYKVEKALVNLCEFAKTKELAPGESDTVTMAFSVRDMASWSSEIGQYVLENGTYKIAVATNAKTAHTAPADVFEVTVADGKLNGAEFKGQYFKADEKGGIVYTADEKTGVAYENRFADAKGDDIVSAKYLERIDVDGVPTVKDGTFPVAPYAEGTEGESYKILSRFETYKDSVALYDRNKVTELEDAAPTSVRYYDEDGKVDIYTLEEVYADLQKDGADEDAIWTKFVQQLSAYEMIYLTGLGGFKIAELDQYGIPLCRFQDGPTTLLISRNGDTDLMAEVGYPTNSCRAASWNKELEYQVGVLTGYVGYYCDYQGWYAPAANLHRSPLSGRNYEYYSEDPYLAGTFAALETKGANEHGLIVNMKHFALNDQEEQRTGVSEFITEQALREIYLNAFEIGIKGGDAHGVMTAYNRIGTTWCGANKALLQGILRGEWGFVGVALTDALDMWKYQYMDPVSALYAGNEQLLASSWTFDSLAGRAALDYYYQNPVDMTDVLQAATRNICNTVFFTNAFDPDYVPQGITDIGYAPTFTVGKDTLDLTAEELDTTLTFTVTVKNNIGLSAAHFDITGIDFTGAEVTANFGDLQFNSLHSDLQIVWWKEDAPMTDGLMFTITLKLTEEQAKTFAPGEYPIHIVASDVHNRLIEFVDTKTVDGSLTVIAPQWQKGDVTRNGYVDNADLVYLARYLVKLETLDEEQLEIGDYNDDGEVDNGDLVMLARYLVGLDDIHDPGSIV